MKKAFILFLSTFSFVSYSQEVVSTQGDSYSNGTANIDFTIGEVVIDTGTDGVNDITQGFHQTNWNFLSFEDNSPEIIVSIFPNPVRDILIIETEKNEGLNFLLLNNEGRTILENIIEDSRSEINTSRLPSGEYSILLKRDDNIIKTYKLIKIK